MNNPYETTEPREGPPGPQWNPYVPREQARMDWARVTHNWLVVLALIVLSLSLVTALIAANQAITIWMRPQYAPFVRTGGAIAVAALSLYVVLRLTRRRAT